MATFLNVNSICKDADLAAEVGGLDVLNRINPSTAQRDLFRASALNDVVAALLTRSPPVADSDLTDPTELKMAVCYRALSKIYGRAITQVGDRNDALAKGFETSYLGAIRSRYTVSQGQTSPAGGTFSFERR